MSDLKKLYQPLNPLFEPNPEEWNKKENELHASYRKEIIKQENEEKKVDLHKKNIGEILYHTRVTFFSVLGLLLDKKNPIPYIMSEDMNQLSFCIIILVIGILMLLVSNLLI